MPSRLGVQKTYKLFVGGKFPRTESGRYLRAINPKTGEHLANYCHASRKDLRDAVRAARGAQSDWAEKSSAFLKSQILYRVAEMLESRREALTSELVTSTEFPKIEADREVASAIDHMVYFAGWADKFQQVFGSVNPVASPHFNFSTLEPSGVVVIFCPDLPPLAGLVATIAPAILSGNTCVVVASETDPLPAISLAEALATSDLPAGVVNILTGKRKELAPHVASHMDVNGIVDCSGDPSISPIIQCASSTNLKRIFFKHLSPNDWLGDRAREPYSILDTVEVKTAWHPIGT